MIENETVTIAKEEYIMLCKRSAELAEKSSRYVELCKRSAELAAKASTPHHTAFDKLRAENEALKLALEASQVDPVEGIVSQFIDQALLNAVKSQEFENRVNEEIEKAITKYTGSEAFGKRIDDAIEEDLNNRTIDVDDAVEKAIEDALQDVQISCRNR